MCKDTESEVFNDMFFCSHDVVVNALDNVEARMYIDRYTFLVATVWIVITLLFQSMFDQLSAFV